MAAYLQFFKIYLTLSQSNECFNFDKFTYLPDVLLHELRADNSNEASVGPVSNGPSTERLARARGAKQQHTFWRLNPKVNKSLWLWQRHKFYTYHFS